ncbi:MAG: iron-sulfur cluster repair di-iron protein [Chitinophagaceae bacterium]|nr:iron-sulfur cluster repair di-iron protein [Chitinophagaceae bacterium]
MQSNTLAAIVTGNTNAVSVFEKYGLDFCCKGKRTLEAACAEKNISSEEVVKEINERSGTSGTQLPFAEMTASQLIEHIVRTHHAYIRQTAPVIQTHLEKVILKHGERFPYIVKVHKLFCELTQELISHLYKEENILFERITAYEHAGNLNMPTGFLRAPINVMEQEHETAGQLMEQINRLTNNYTSPAGACTTFKIVLNELKAFELDLHKHIHLENNILFSQVG